MQTQVKTYRGSQSSAASAFKRDAVQMAARGWHPVSQTWAQGSYGVLGFLIGLLLCVVVIGFFVILYMLVVKPAGTLTVTYAVQEAAPAAVAEKTCPKCAESVKAAAAVCRFCGHEFPAPKPTPVPTPSPSHPAIQPAQHRSGFYDIGVWFGSMWTRRWFKIATIAVPLLVFLQFETSRAVHADDAAGLATASVSPSSRAIAASSAEDAGGASCQAERGQRVATYQALFKAGKPRDAADAVRACAKTLDDPELRKLVAEAEVAAYKLTINSAKARKEDRLHAMQALVREYPEVGKPYEAKIASLGLQVAKEEAAAEAARRRKEGVHIGMTEDDVRQSSWGRPQSVNRTIMASGTHEQWVYEGGYLYFENGVLTSIQN